MSKRYGFAGIGLAAALAMPAPACAQTAEGVQVYGAVDLGVEIADNGKSQIRRLSSGLNTVSRFGVRGSEDLGGGLKANFRLESGINADDGMPNNAAKWWSRWNHVGVSGPWGAVDLGRMWSPTFIVGLSSDPLARNRTSLGWNMFLQQSGATATAFTPGFIDNSVRYTSPRVGGAWGELMYTFGEASNSSGNGLGMNLQYADGPLYLGYGYQRLNGGSSAAPAPNPKPSVSHFVGATYRVGSLTLYGTYNLNTSDEPKVPDSSNAMVSLRWGFAERQAVLAQFAQRRVRDSDIKANGLQLGYDYSLSKRTTLYARYARIDNAGGSAITLNGVALSAVGADPSFFALGVSHVF